jgi:hypothetical protein
MDKPVNWKQLRDRLLCGATDPGGIRLSVYESHAQLRWPMRGESPVCLPLASRRPLTD